MKSSLLDWEKIEGYIPGTNILFAKLFALTWSVMTSIEIAYTVEYGNMGCQVFKDKKLA